MTSQPPADGGSGPRDAQISAAEAASRALRHHLEEVERYLRTAAAEASLPPEDVHRLRVATRRASAVLRIYKDFLPRKRRRRLVVALKEIRKAAGEARDFDVLLERKLASEANASFLRVLRTSRQKAQHAMTDVYDAAATDFSREVDATLRTLNRDARGCPRIDASFEAFARAHLHDASVSFFDEWPEDLTDPSILHRLRVRAKSLRYTLELLSDAFPPLVQGGLADELRELQQQLGALNDHATAMRLLQQKRVQDAALQGGVSEELEGEVDREAAGLAREMAHFSEHWPSLRRDALSRAVSQLLGARTNPTQAQDLDSGAAVESSLSSPSSASSPRPAQPVQPLVGTETGHDSEAVAVWDGKGWRRRFRLRGPVPRSVLSKSKPFEQLFMVGDMGGELRLRRDPEGCVLSVKDVGLGVTRLWRQARVPLWVFEWMRGRAFGRIDKTRYPIPHEGARLRMDRFHGSLDGLWLLSAEFTELEDAERFRLPGWAREAEEVTRDLRYLGRNLVVHGVPD